MIGQTISHYKIIDKLGSGGMGTVYKAQDTKLDRFVALKFLPPHLSQTEAEKKRFIHEAKSASALDHPNICSIYEINETDDGRMFIAMACYEGESLKEKIAQGPLPMESALDIASQIARGLEKAHAKEIVHRDIKPANILITEDGVVKIVDFGLAKLAGQTKLTKTGSTLGTVAYMSPEQARGTVVDERTDIWAFGVILYEMLTGKPPFTGDYEQAVIYSILNEHPDPVKKYNASVPESLEQVVSKALEKKPEKRYQQAGELLDDLKSISEGIVPEEIKSRVRKAQLRKRKKVILYAFSAVLIIAAVVVVSFLIRQSQTIDSIAVLPLKNLTGNAEQDYFVEGMTDEMIGKLGQISGLRRVISRTSVMRYKDTDKTLPEIARELNVDAVVEGTVYQVGENVSIKLQLFDALPEERSLWTQRYDRPVANVLVIYGEMAAAIAENIQIPLTADETARFAGARQIDPEVYDAYLKARSSWEEGREELYKGLELLNSAVKKNPDWAPLYAGLAETWMWIQQLGFEPTSVTSPRIYENLNKAMELDPNLSEAHRLNGMIAQLVEWNWEKSEKAFLKALAINPNDALSRMFYAQLLLILHRSEEALAQRELAISLDPLGPMMQLLNLGTLVLAGDYETSLSLAEELVAADPENFNINGLIELIAYRCKKYDKVIKAIRYALPFPMEEETFKEIERIYRESGIVAAYEEILKHLEKFAENNYVGFQDMALRYIMANQTDKAMDWVEKGFEMHEPQMTYITTPGRYFDRLFGNPRFIAICKKMKLPLSKMGIKP
jgi:serine/threonine protein kinase